MTVDREELLDSIWACLLAKDRPGLQRVLGERAPCSGINEPSLKRAANLLEFIEDHWVTTIELAELAAELDSADSDVEFVESASEPVPADAGFPTSDSAGEPIPARTEPTPPRQAVPSARGKADIETPAEVNPPRRT